LTFEGNFSRWKPLQGQLHLENTAYIAYQVNYNDSQSHVNTNYTDVFNRVDCSWSHAVTYKPYYVSKREKI